MFVYGSLFTLCGHQFSMWFTCCSSLEDFPFWPTLFDLDIFYPVYFNSFTSVFSYHSLWLLLGLRFLLSCPKGQDTLVSFLLLPVVHEQVNMINFSQQFERFEKWNPQDISIVTAICHDVKVSYDMHQLYYTYNKCHCILIQSFSK